MLKHQWLFLNTLDTVGGIKKLVAFRGQTPEEMYFGTGASVPAELEAARKKTREARADANRKRTCSAYELVAVSLN